MSSSVARAFAFQHHLEVWHVNPHDDIDYSVRIVGSTLQFVIVQVIDCSSDFVLRVHGYRPFRAYFKPDEFVSKEINHENAKVNE